MAGFRLEDFSGIRPRASDIRLDEAEAVTAQDVDLRKGLLRPRPRQNFWDPESDPSISMADEDSPQSLFRFHRADDNEDFWMYWTADVDVVPGPVDSVDQRHYYTGDGIPKMFTADSIDDLTPPYPESPDPKYPYSWYALGVPAPGTAPEIDADEITPPSEGSTGLVTKVAVDNLVFNINNNLANNSGLTQNAAGSDGKAAGVGTTNVRAQDGGQPVTCLRLGTRVRVTEIVDANHVKVVAAGRTGPIEDLGMIPDSSIWRWDNGLPDVNKHTWLTRLNSTAKRKSWMLMPDEATFEVENHALRVNDIIRITGAGSPMLWDSTPTMITTPVPGSAGPNTGYRTATADSGDIEFEGSASFAIERDGEEIDPVVPAGDEFEISSRAYLYTYVSALGEESAPSPASNVITIRDGDPVTIETFEAPPTAHRNIDRIWIYRTNTGTNDTAFQFVGELAVADILTGFVDDVDDDELGEVLETEGWDVPRQDMHSIISMPNGMMVGLSGKRLCFSVPGFPHAWPREYEQLIDFDGVGLEVFGNSVYIATTGKPYIGIGVHPLQVSLRRVETLQACIDKRAFVNTGERILYCSREGLISGGADGFYNVTEKHYTKEQWTRIVGPDNATSQSLRAWYFDSQMILLAAYTWNATMYTNKLIFDFRDEKLRITTFTETPLAAFADPELAELYYISDLFGTPENPGGEDEPSYFLQPTFFAQDFLAAGLFTSLIGPGPAPGSGFFADLFAPGFWSSGFFTSVSATPAATRRLLRWDYEHPSANLATDFATGDWISRACRLPRPMALSCARVVCRRVPAVNGNSLQAHGEVLLTVRGRRYDLWGTAATPGEDDIVLINAQPLISGQPGSGGWVGEQRSAPFRIAPNVVVDALTFEFHVEGPVEVETVSLGEAMEDLEQT